MLNTDHELDRQRDVLLHHRFPDLVELAEDTFSDAVEALRPALRDRASSHRSPATAPFVLVVSGGAARDMTAAERHVPLLRLAEESAPGVLDPNHGEKNACFMLSGSRRGDRRVPALWMSGRAPKLGWCWDGNPHSWLGVANTGARLAAGGPVRPSPSERGD